MPMSTDSAQDTVEPGFSDAGVEVYQSVSRAGITSLVLGLLSVGSYWFLVLMLLPIIGVIFAIIAFVDFKKFPGELVGKPVAITGLLLCCLIGVTAPVYHTVVYLTEVPEGYERVDFSKLLSEAGKPEGPTSFAISKDGEQIFIKGYIHPTSMSTLKAKKFVIVPDLGTCCFGGQPPLTHMIEVNLQGEQYATKSYRRQRLAGTFKVNRALKKIAELEGVFYQLKADILK
ncbi:MAG: DUF4190 domain-containing protein [Aureliella sp.]